MCRFVPPPQRNKKLLLGCSLPGPPPHPSRMPKVMLKISSPSTAPKMNTQIHRSRNAAGFTLVEILVSMAVLGLMMVGVAQMMNSAINATTGGYKHMDADTQ